MTRRQKKTLLRILISAALLVLAVVLREVVSLPWWGALFLFLPAYGLIGWDVLWRAVRNIAHGQVFDENFLMAIATVGAFATGEYPEAVFVMLFYQVGELFQNYAVGKSRRSIGELMDIRPDRANVERDGQLLEVEPSQVEIGETIVIKAGERVPLDGVVLEGTSTLDTAALTGEALPREVTAGEDVISGCVNLSGLLRVRVTCPFGQSTVAKILDLVENAGAKKAKAENFITKFARYYTPAVVLGAVLVAVLPPLITGGGWWKWFHQALTFLVISCPCALVISVPLSFFGGIGGASRQGILIKGGSFLEVLDKAETVVFDKTGTLTQGVFNVTAIHPDECSETELLELAALAEAYSDHPISRSLKEAYAKEPDLERVADVTEEAGRGVTALVDGKKVYVGNDKLMEEIGVGWHPCHRAGTTVHVARQGNYLGHIIISDQVKPDSREAIGALKALGVRETVMLTGDAKAVGEEVAARLGMDRVYTQLLPGDKVDRVEELLGAKSPKGALAFVGDGINDAPVLSRVDVGIAMGGLGSDAAIEAADVVIMDDKPSKVAAAIRLARRTMRIVRENIVFALAVKGIILVLGAMGLANMWLAVFADVGVSVLAICNAMRAMRVTVRSARVGA